MDSPKSRHYLYRPTISKRSQARWPGKNLSCASCMRGISDETFPTTLPAPRTSFLRASNPENSHKYPRWEFGSSVCHMVQCFVKLYVRQFWSFRGWCIKPYHLRLLVSPGISDSLLSTLPALTQAGRVSKTLLRSTAALDFLHPRKFSRTLAAR